MSYQPLPQKQLFTVGQIVAAISIVACLVFIVSYSGRIIMDKKVQANQERYQEEVTAAEALGGEIQQMISDVNTAGVVEPYAREQRNMGLPGEQSVAPLPMEIGFPEHEQQGDVSEIEFSDEEIIPNWQLWLDFVIAGGNNQ